MKLQLALLTALIGSQLHAQVTNAEMRGDFAEAAKLGRIQGAESLPVYTSNNIKGSRYLTSDWTTGKIVSTTGLNFDNARIMFDKQEQDVYIQATGGQIVKVNKDQIKSFTINDRTFVSGSQLQGGDKNKYYELLTGNDQSIALYKQITTRFIKANRNDAARIEHNDFDDEFRDEAVYFVKSPNQSLKQVKTNERSFAKALPEKASNISNYFNNHYNDEMNDKLLVGLVNFLNS